MERFFDILGLAINSTVAVELKAKGKKASGDCSCGNHLVYICARVGACRAGKG